MEEFLYEVDAIIESYLSEFEPISEERFGEEWSAKKRFLVSQALNNRADTLKRSSKYYEKLADKTSNEKTAKKYLTIADRYNKRFAGADKHAKAIAG